MFKEWKFWNNINKLNTGYESPSPCWIWKGAKDKDGYGVTTYNSKYIHAHRLALILKSPNLDQGLKALHKCNIKPCINPDHLYWGDASQNAIDSVNANTHVRARKTHCKNGHEFNEYNTRYHTSKKGKFQRMCLLCESARNAARYH